MKVRSEVAQMRIRSAIIGATLLGLLCFVACGESDFVVHVVFPESVGIQEDAPVLYQGLVIGELEAISLHQESPERPAKIRLTLAISDPRVTLREQDAFHVTSGNPLGKRSLRIVPSSEPSPPLESGATVAGVPPLVTRVGESVDAAVEALTELAAETAQQVLDDVSKSLEERHREEPSAPQAKPPPPAPEPGQPRR
jgi:ABC-type transporter Mla subunit MlaD